MPLIKSTQPLTLGRAPTAQPHYLVFFASGQPPWCPDCVRALPLLERVFGQGTPDDGDGTRRADVTRVASTEGCAPSPCPTAYMLYVGDRDEWKGNQTHWARTQYGVRGVPTLLKWHEGKEVARLEEEGCQDLDALNVFVRGTTAGEKQA